jgi:hypothetical protein
MGFGYCIINAASIALAVKKLAALHQSKMFGCHVAGNFASLGQFANGISTSQQHLNHAQSMRMGERFEALGRLFQFPQFQQWGRFFGGGHKGVPYLNTQIYRNITTSARCDLVDMGGNWAN